VTELTASFTAAWTIFDALARRVGVPKPAPPGQW
jgi:hypothetical protein